MKVLKYIKALSLPEDWDHISNSVYQERSFLSYLEQTNYCDQRYYALLNDNNVVAGAILYTQKVDLFTFSKINQKLKMQIIGLPLSNDDSGLIGDSEYANTLVSKILEIEKGTILCLNHDQCIDHEQVIKMKTLPSMILKLQQNSWEEYIETLRYPYRRRLLKSVKKSKGLEQIDSSCKRFSQIHYQQYLEVIDRSKTKLEVLDLAFFERLPDAFKLQSFYQNEKLLYWNITVADGDILNFVFGGYDSDSRNTFDSYNNNLISIIKAGFKRNFRSINLGQTAEIPKSRFGALVQPKNMFLYHSNPLIRGLYRSIRKLITNSSEPVSHNIFKNQTSSFEPLSEYKKYSKAHLQQLLSLLKMDKSYTKAKGDFIYSFDGKKYRKYLDLAGGYGSLLLGHNHPDLVSAAKENLDRNIISHHQLSSKPSLNELGRRINDLMHSATKSNYTTVALNTGSEAVEAAIKHAMLSFEYKVSAIQKEINRSLVYINESYYQNGKKSCLNYDNFSFKSIEELRSYLNVLNSSVHESYKPRIIATNRSFHGKTLGALALTYNPEFRRSFTKNSPIDTIFVDGEFKISKQIFEDNSFDVYIPKLTKDGQLSFKHKRLNWIVAAIIEPIIGEGGVHVLPRKFLRSLRESTSNYKIPLICDEIQSGCFRTGSFLASFQSELFADYYILGKSLGGGLSKISALVIEENQYIPEFDVIHSSTFSEDDYSTTLAIKSLDLLSSKKRLIEQKADYFWQRLKELEQQYPDIIKEIRGLGLMIGIEFKNMDLSSSYGIQGISRSKYFGYVLAAYLLNTNSIRVSVTLSNSRTIRLLPSLYISHKQIDSLIEALKGLCQILSYGDFYSLISFLLPSSYQKLRSPKNYNPSQIPLDNCAEWIDQVGFLLHYIDIHTIRAYLPSLNVLPDTVVLDLIKQLGYFSEPVIIGRNKIKDVNNNAIGITFVGLSFTARMVSDTMRKSIRGLHKYQLVCDKAIDTLERLGITKIGLGQYTSIIMQNGKAVSNPNIRVTTGNGFTAYSVLHKIREAIKNRSDSEIKLGVVGASGNIAKVLSGLLIQEVDHILLFGRRNGNFEKLESNAGQLIIEIIEDIEAGSETDNQLYQQIKLFAQSKTILAYRTKRDYQTIWNAYTTQFNSESRIHISCDLKQLSQCNVVLVATSDPNPFLRVTHFKEGTFICDISVPLNCDEELLNNSNYDVSRGGLINLPNEEKLCPPGLHLGQGQAYACMVETMLMGFEQTGGIYSYGDISKTLVNDLGNRLLSHGVNCDYVFQELSI